MWSFDDVVTLVVCRSKAEAERVAELGGYSTDDSEGSLDNQGSITCPSCGHLFQPDQATPF